MKGFFLDESQLPHTIKAIGGLLENHKMLRRTFDCYGYSIDHVTSGQTQSIPSTVVIIFFFMC